MKYLIMKVRGFLVVQAYRLLAKNPPVGVQLHVVLVISLDFLVQLIDWRTQSFDKLSDSRLFHPENL